jgi:hypothetical protein
MRPDNGTNVAEKSVKADYLKLKRQFKTETDKFGDAAKNISELTKQLKSTK